MREPNQEEYRDDLPVYQKLYWFDNGYGASVVKGPYTYGGPELWELAVLKGNGERAVITYNTEITDDVIGYLTDDEVDELLERIENLG